MNTPRALLCTVGTGNLDQLRESLLEPLTKSIRQGDWSRVIMLPSQVTAGHAAILQRELSDLPIDIQPLPVDGGENDADACFAHFDRAIESLRTDGHRPEEILVDFTRGTKAMSAALVLAAVRHDLPQLRYVSGGDRDQRGMVVPGTEVVTEVRTTIATARKRLDDAFLFFQRGNFAAVLELLPDPKSPFAAAWPPELLQLSHVMRPVAQGYAAWDRLDYKAAARVDYPQRSPQPRWDRFLPSENVRSWLACLANPLPEPATDRAEPLRCLAADLLANGERRLRDHQYEDALIRAYRVLELVGQFRLCDRGIHSDNLPQHDPIVRAFQEELEKRRQTQLSMLSKGRLAASREQAARLLGRFGDPLASELIKLGTRGVVNVNRRNYSALIHGFESASGSDPQPLADMYASLEQLLVQDGGESARSRLQSARSLDFTRP